MTVDGNWCGVKQKGVNGMSKVDFQHTTGNGLTLIGFDEVIPNNLLSDTVRIDGADYKTEIVYDLPNHIAILGEGDFLGKEVEFVK